MSERNSGFEPSLAPPDAINAGPGGGALLKAAREAAGLHIGALAVTLKVPVKKLEALESDRLDLLPDAVFVRGLASSVCRTLKIDARPVLARLPLTPTPQLKTDQGGINAPFRAPGTQSVSLVRDQLFNPIVMAVLALLVGSLLLWVTPPVERLGAILGLSQPESNTAPSASVDGLPATPPPLAPAAAPVPNSPVAPDAAPTGQAAAVLAGASAAGMPSQSPPGSAVAAATPAPPAQTGSSSLAAQAAPTSSAPLLASATPSFVTAPAVAPAAGLLIKARGASWVEVTDAMGVVHLRRMMTAGEAVGISGRRPLAVVLGHADVVELTLAGKPVDVPKVSRDRVARFEVR